jgi:two-component system NtrC family response regulator
MKKILIVEDDESLRRVLEIRLKGYGFEIYTAEDGLDGLGKFERHKPDLVLTDIKMPNMDGFELLQKLKAINENSIIIIMTAFSDVNIAVKAMKLGANDFLPKPFDKDYLKHVIDKALNNINLKEEVKELKKQISGFTREIIYKSENMKNLLEIVNQVASSDATVLIIGESGVGKELIAQRIHQNSDRKNQSFIALNCAAIPKELIESELFGHIKGAFTGADKKKRGKFELANNGTIFLDEIGEMPLSLQPRLLRVLQERKVTPIGAENPIDLNIRIIAATNKNLQEEVNNKTFREDLYYRLNVFPIEIPPLNKRKDDITILIEYFLIKYNSKVTKFTKEFENYIKNYSWPGNIRELENISQRIAILSKGKNVLDLDFIKNILPYKKIDSHFELPDDIFDLEQFEINIIKESLIKNNNNKTQTAKYLNMPRHILIYKMEKYGL